jgi:hypothetical protein
VEPPFERDMSQMVEGRRIRIRTNLNEPKVRGDKEISFWNDEDLRREDATEAWNSPTFPQGGVAISVFNIWFSNIGLNLSPGNPRSVMRLLRDSFSDKWLNNSFCCVRNGDLLFSGSTVWTSKLQITVSNFNFGIQQTQFETCSLLHWRYQAGMSRSEIESVAYRPSLPIDQFLRTSSEVCS